MAFDKHMGLDSEDQDKVALNDLRVPRRPASGSSVRSDAAVQHPLTFKKWSPPAR